MDDLGVKESVIEDKTCFFWRNGIFIDHLGNARYCSEVNVGNQIGNIMNMDLEELYVRKQKMFPFRRGTVTCPIKEQYLLQ